MRIIRTMTILCICIITFGNAQIMVVSQNKVKNTKEYFELAEKYWYPIFDKLVDEGK